MQFCNHTLANGLEVVAECNPQAYSVGLAFFVKTGSRDESEDIWGVSHFLEHMAFKGTPNRSAADVNRELDEIGSHSNAYTSEEQTVYHATLLPEYQQQGAELLADIMRPSLRQDDFDTEKQVILEEIAKYEDQPPFGAYEKVMANHFQQHPLARSVLGTTDSVSALTSDQMRAYFENRYSPSNITLVAAGKVDFDQLVASAQRHCGSWPTFDVQRKTPRADDVCSFELIKKPSAAQQYIVQISNGPAATDTDRYAARVLATIVGDDSGSRMFWEFVETGLAEYAAVGSYEYQGTGTLMTFLCCAPEQAAENLKGLYKLQQKIQLDGVTEAELEQAKSKIASHIVLQSERPANRMFAVGNHWIQRAAYRSVRDVIDSYQSVTLDEVNQVLNKYPLTTNTTVAVGPLTSLDPPWPV